VTGKKSKIMVIMSSSLPALLQRSLGRTPSRYFDIMAASPVGCGGIAHLPQSDILERLSSSIAEIGSADKLR
jgi:hypothetical protein